MSRAPPFILLMQILVVAIALTQILEEVHCGLWQGLVGPAHVL